jgi:tripartite-type tricarboxylate transporter receptor subunit TctC
MLVGELPMVRLARIWLVLCLLGGSAGLALADYPTKPIKIILSNSAGGSPDIVMRIVADRLSKALGQQVFIDNRPGGESVIGADLAARAAPDGYTLYLGTNDALVANRFRLRSTPYDPDKDFVLIASIIDSAPFVVAVRSDLPARTFDELIGLARSSPGKLTYGTTIGISDTLAQWINKRTGIDIVRVPYRQNPQAVQDLLGGQVQVVLISLPSVDQFVKAGQLRILAVSSAQRFPGLPDVPTIAESSPGLVIEGWFCLAAPAGLSPAIAQRLNQEVDKALKDRELLERVASFGFSTSGAKAPDALIARMREDVARWKRIADDIGMRPQ